MKRLKIWDLLATVLVTAIVVPYVGYLVRGTMPFIQDAQGMAETGFVLGAAVMAIVWYGSEPAELTSFEKALGLGAILLGGVALAAAGTVAAESMLAVFMMAILVTWAVEILRHTGMIAARKERSAPQ
jgi:hypothetical protein